MGVGSLRTAFVEVIQVRGSSRPGFFLDAVDAEGGRLMVTDPGSFYDAVQAAALWEADGIEVRYPSEKTAH